MRCAVRSGGVGSTENVEFTILTSLRNVRFNPSGEGLLRAVRQCEPSKVLVTNSVVIEGSSTSLGAMSSLLQDLTRRCPICCTLKGRRCGLCEASPRRGYVTTQCRRCRGRLGATKVRVLRGRSYDLRIKGADLAICNLRMPLVCCGGPFSPRLGERRIERLVKRPSSSSLGVLLTRDPGCKSACFS